MYELQATFVSFIVFWFLKTINPSIVLRSFLQSLKNLLSQQINVSNYSGSTRFIDSNTQRFDHQSAPITTGQIDKDM